MSNVFKFICLVIAVLACACSVDVERPSEPCPEPAPPVCAPVACGWTAEGTCPDGVSKFSYENSSEAIDDGATTCWYFTAACIVTPRQPVDAACIPDSCKQNQFTTCSKNSP